MSERESVIERVQKLLALAAEEGGGTEAERMNAAAKAHALMAKHNLEMLEVEAASGEGPMFGEDTERFTAMKDHWKGLLLASIGKSVNVHVHYSSESKAVRNFTLVGRPDSIAFCRSLAAYLIPDLEIQCEADFVKARNDGAERRCGKCRGTGVAGWYKCSSCNGTGRRPIDRCVFRRSFYEAAVHRIHQRLLEQKAQEEQEAGETGMSLVRNDEANLARYVREQHGPMRSSRPRRSTSSAEGHRAGSVAGQNADLSGGKSMGRSKAQIGSGM